MAFTATEQIKAEHAENQEKLDSLTAEYNNVLETYQELDRRIGEVDFPNRLEKIDTLLGTLANQGQGMLNRLEDINVLKEISNANSAELNELKRKNEEINKTIKEESDCHGKSLKTLKILIIIVIFLIILLGASQGYLLLNQ